MNIGELDRYITIESPTNVNTKGSHSITWASYGSMWAKRLDNKGTTTEEDGKRTSKRNSQWAVYTEDSIDETCRFYETDKTGTVYYIESIEGPSNREGHFMILNCYTKN